MVVNEIAQKSETLWLVKLAAWTHDPAEKALVLLRDPEGHEKGTVDALRKAIFPEELPEALKKHVTRADHWSSAADRPQFPREKGEGRYVKWAQVRFDEHPVLIHPLSGKLTDIKEGFREIDPRQLKAVSTDHFNSLIVRNEEGEVDLRKTALSFWRFGPDTPAKELGTLWGVLPADTRVPDHTIWSHLDLTSAFATAFAADPNGSPALLCMSFGPVQDFIAQSRSTSDLWAGSHILSYMVWEGLKSICSAFGPEVVIFPQLRRVPLVDLWLQNDQGLPENLFKDEPWRHQKTDANPLFAAALPNRFVAIVPESLARSLAENVAEQVRSWVLEAGQKAANRLIKESGLDLSATFAGHEQVKEQLTGFPEIFWTALPWSLIQEEKDRIETSPLEEALALFYPRKGKERGFLGSPVWAILQREISVEGASFYRPNPGVLYPAFYDLLDRAAAATKSIRPFYQQPQNGYRCSLCGEREWLTANRDQLFLPPGQRKDTLWSRVADRRPAWARKGEHLCALCALKRLWPSLFVDQIRHIVPMERYVVSTHTMALSTSLGQWLRKSERKPLTPKLTAHLENNSTSAALPRKLDTQLRGESDEVNKFARRLPVLLDELRAALDSPAPVEREQAKRHIQQMEEELKQLFGHSPEAYYGLILMDGDCMGAWISGTDPRFQISNKETWHPQICTSVGESFKDGPLKDYLEAKRPSSPGKHIAISSALNAFSLDLARYVLEDVYKGKLLYSGGDDVLGMICVDDLLSAMLMLRLVYSGIFPAEDKAGAFSFLGLESDLASKVDIANSHVMLTHAGKRNLFRVMGGKATASIGAVVAHHTTPLSHVLHILRQTEKRAKTEGGRNAFSLALLKRAGSSIELTCPWFVAADEAHERVENLKISPMGLLIRFRDVLAKEKISRRCPYLVQEWVNQMPRKEHLQELSGNSATYRSLIEKNLAYQFRRQTKRKEWSEDNAALGIMIAQLALELEERKAISDVRKFIRDFLASAEFMAREGRADKMDQES